MGEGARFCASCGHALISRSDERRIATVLFADLVGFTSLSETRDPEQVKNLVDACFQLLVRDVTSFGGQVDKIIGDAIVALFGAPVAHEDDAERAVRAALRMQETVRAYRADTGAAGRAAHRGQHRRGAGRRPASRGRLHGHGRRGQHRPATRDGSRARQRGGGLELPRRHPRGHLVPGLGLRSTSKGRDEPVEAWIALEPLLPPGHRPRRMQTPFLGRESELGALAHAVDSAVERQRSHLLLLIGEAGVGKSRLAEEAADAARCHHDARVLEGRCVPYGEANVWWPMAEALRQACDIAADSGLAVAEPQARASGGRGPAPAGRRPRGGAGGQRAAVPHGLRGPAA